MAEGEELNAMNEAKCHGIIQNTSFFISDLMDAYAKIPTAGNAIVLFLGAETMRVRSCL